MHVSQFQVNRLSTATDGLRITSLVRAYLASHACMMHRSHFKPQPKVTTSAITSVIENNKTSSLLPCTSID